MTVRFCCVVGNENTQVRLLTFSHSTMIIEEKDQHKVAHKTLHVGRIVPMWTIAGTQICTEILAMKILLYTLNKHGLYKDKLCFTFCPTLRNFIVSTIDKDAKAIHFGLDNISRSSRLCCRLFRQLIGYDKSI